MIADVTHSLGTDFYHLDELLTDEERAIRDKVRAFCDREVIPDHQRLLGAGRVPLRADPEARGAGHRRRARSRATAAPA